MNYLQMWTGRAFLFGGIFRIIRPWDLMPMESRLNSAKGSKLPKWDPFFAGFARNQYIMYQLIYEQEGIRKLYDSCYKDNLHSIWASQELYRKGNTEKEFVNILEKNMLPLYESAKRQGYETWNLVGGGARGQYTEVL